MIPISLMSNPQGFTRSWLFCAGPNTNHLGLILFGFRNEKKSLKHLTRRSGKILLTLRGERSETGRLPELRRRGIRDQTVGVEWKVRRRGFHPHDLSCMSRQRKETSSDLTYNRRLTARPAVLAKRMGPDRQLVPSNGPVCTYLLRCLVQMIARIGG